MIWNVRHSKGQMKVQQMAFVLVAIVIFFALVGLVVLAFSFSGLKTSAEDLKSQEALAAVRSIATSPEFTWTIDDCASCVDMDKLMALKNRRSYEGFWDFSLLRIERVYPSFNGECTESNYPNCNSITLVDSSRVPGSKSAFVSLCRWDSKEDFYKCELGRLVVSEEAVG